MLSLVAAVLGALLWNGSMLMQAHDARQAPQELSMKPGLLFHLLRRKWWILGTVGSIAAVLLQIFALEKLSIALVQALAAGGIILLPLYALWRGERAMSAIDWAALLVIVAGVALTGYAIPEQAGQRAFSLTALSIAILSVSAAGYALVRTSRNKIALAILAGVAFGAAGLLQKTLALETNLASEAWIAVLFSAMGAFGFLAEMSAMQAGAVTVVAPMILAVSSVLPTVAARWAFGEQWPQPGLTIIALLLALGGATFMSRRAHTH